MTKAPLVKMTDEACNNPERHPMPDCLTGTDSVALFSKVRQLCQHMNQWFDVCNGKDTFNPFAKALKPQVRAMQMNSWRFLLGFVIGTRACSCNQGNAKRHFCDC
jgi:hypothetical protein